MNKITYKKIGKGKFLFCKDGVYFSLNKDQIETLLKLLNDIKNNNFE